MVIVIALLGVVAGIFCGICYAQREWMALLEQDREAARHEANVLRGIIAPGLMKQQAMAGAAASQTVQPTRPPVATPDPNSFSGRLNFRRPRTLSTRKWFNIVRQSSNSKQRHVDAVASALESQSRSQEKKHV